MRIRSLALFTRALRLESRSFFTYAIRFSLAATVFVVLWTNYLSAARMGAPGLNFFQSVLYINLVFISLIGISYFSSAITEEKEEMTLGLLTMANLSSFSILLGKSTSRLIGVLLLLSTQLPFAMLAVTLGGISAKQIVAAYISLLAYVIFINCLGLLASVICKKSSSAARLTVIFLIMFFAVPLILRYFIAIALAAAGQDVTHYLFLAIQKACNFLLLANPFTRAQAVLVGGIDSIFHNQVWACLALALPLFLMSQLLFGVFANQKADTNPGPARGLMGRSGTRFRFFSPPRAWSMTLIWKDYYFMHGGLNAAVIKIALILFVVTAGAVAVWQGTNILSPFSGGQLKARDIATGAGTTLLIVMVIAIICECVLSASRLYSEEVKWKTISSIIALPCSLRKLTVFKVLGHMIALWPYLVLMILGAILIGDAFVEGTIEAIEGVLNEPIILVGMIVGLLTFLFYLHLIVYLSLIFKKGAIAVAMLAWFIVWIATTIFSVFTGRLGLSGEAFTMFLAIAMVLGIVVMIKLVAARLELAAAQ